MSHRQHQQIRAWKTRKK